MEHATDDVNTERHRVQKEALVHRPAFPLGVVSLTGLTIAVHNTLYGAIEGKRMFKNFHPLQAATGALKEDLERLSVI